MPPEDHEYQQARQDPSHRKPRPSPYTKYFYHIYALPDLLSGILISNEWQPATEDYSTETFNRETFKGELKLQIQRYAQKVFKGVWKTDMMNRVINNAMFLRRKHEYIFFFFLFFTCTITHLVLVQSNRIYILVPWHNQSTFHLLDWAKI